MKKKYFICTSLLVIIGLLIYFSNNTKVNNKEKEVVYNGNNLLISIDGKSSSTLPTSGTYYLVDYKCKNKNTELSWDKDEYKLNVSNKNKKAGVSCFVEFKSQPLLSEMSVGSYVEYVGEGGTVGSTHVQCQTNGPDSSSIEDAETEAPNSCLGQNAREDLDTSGYTYGYCYGSRNYYTTGWRIAYIDSNNKPVIISAGSPECNARESIAGNTTYIKMANTKAMKYCNSNLVDGDCSCLDSNSDGYCDCTDSDSDGLCDEIENNEVDAWAIGDIDFYNMTKAISGYGKRLSSDSSSLGDSGGSLGTTLFCYSKYSYEECGYNNDLIDNGGYYWFSARFTSSYTEGVSWSPFIRTVNYNSGTEAYGLRPLISLSSSVIVTGGDGTMENPYKIGRNNFLINNGSSYVNSSDDLSNIVLNMVAFDDVDSMCISVDSSGCSNYIDFSETYTLNWSNESEGEKVIYVYYKDNKGEIVASMNRSVILDKTSPTNNSIEIGNEGRTTRTLTLNSNGADYMCFSNTSNNANNCTNWVNYETTYTWKFDGEGSKTVYAFFKDEAGNISDAVSDTVTITKECLSVDSVISLDYTGEVVNSLGLEDKLCYGSYKVQVWGAQGGNSGGKGGYSVGDIILTGSETLYFYVGGMGDKGVAGFNGGGSTGSGGGGGGGATDIRIGSDSLYARVIVAGGGGGKGADSCANGGAGGGTSGIGGNSQGSCGTQGGAGTQNAGGVVGVYSSTNGANPGVFGIGGDAADGSYDGGGGGGGWYGGGAGASAGWSNGGGGGSGFVYTSGSTLPSGYLVNSNYYLSNASTIDGDQATIPTIDGTGTETGHAGNGYIKITRLT